MTGLATVLADARALLGRGELTAADAAIDRALPGLQGPERGALLHLRGVIAGRRRDAAAARSLLEEAVACAPALTEAWLSLGHALARDGDLARAALAYRNALRLDPSAADAWYNLGVVQHRQSETGAAAAAFHRAWQLDPTFDVAAKGCMRSLASLVRAETTAVLPRPAPEPVAWPRLSVVVCSNDDGRAARARAVFDAQLARVPAEYIAIRDARSLAEAYNRAIATARGDIVVLCHDDVDILVDDFAARIVHHLTTFDAVGVVGSTQFRGPLPVWAGHPHVRGWVTHRVFDSPEWNVDVLHPEPCAGGMAVLDGVMIAGRRGVFEQVQFDAATFDGFHGYDLDWSWRAAQAGFRLAAAGDLMLVHASRGRYDAVWERYAERLASKHGLKGGPAPAGPFYQATLAGATAARSFQARLIELASAARHEMTA